MSLSSWSSPPALPNHGFLLLAMAGCSQSKVTLIFPDHLTAVLEFPGKAQRIDWDTSPLMYVNLSPQKSAVSQGSTLLPVNHREAETPG